MSALLKSAAVILSCVILQLAISAQTAQTTTMDSEQVLAKMEQAGRAFPFIQAGIQKTKYSAVLGRNQGDVQSGKIWISTPANTARRIKVDFDKPLRELFLIDKGLFLHYYPGPENREIRVWCTTSDSR